MKLQKSNVRASVAMSIPAPVLTDPTCPICQEEVGRKSPEGVKESWALTPCGHAFGSVCIKRYLAITDKPLCPVCRQDVFHCCSHPVLPASYDLAKGITRTSYPWAGDPRNTLCPYCMAGKNKPPRFGSEVATVGSGTGEEVGGGARAGGGTNTTSRSIWMRWALSRRVVGAAVRFARHVSKAKPPLPEPEQDQDEDEHEEEVEDDDDDDDEAPELESDAEDDDEPQSPASRDLPPVPGQYGRWELATQEPDWKFLKWFDAQEPKTNATADVTR